MALINKGDTISFDIEGIGQIDTTVLQIYFKDGKKIVKLDANGDTLDVVYSLLEEIMLKKEDNLLEQIYGS
jgi:hypothetical protein